MTVKMVDNLFVAIIEWLATHIPQSLDLFSMRILDGLSPSLTVLLAYFPFLEQAYSVFMWTGLSIIVLMLIMNLLRVFAGPVLDNVEMPFPVLARALLFFFITLNVHHICLMAIDIAKFPYNAVWAMPLFAEAPEMPFEHLFGMILHYFENISLNIIASLIAIFLVVALFINFIRLALEAVERYILIGVCVFLSPIAASLGSSRSTGGVFKSWVRMFASGLFLLTMNVWFIRAFISGIAIGITSQGIVVTDTGYVGSFMLWLFAMLALLKVGQRIDSLMAAVGMNTAQTGHGLYLEAVAAGKMVAGGARAISRRFGEGGSTGKDSNMTEKSSIFTQAHDARKAGVGPRADGEHLADMRRNKAGTQVQSTITNDEGKATTVGKTNLNTGQPPRGAHYISRDEQGVPWAVQAKGANAGAYLGPQFGEYSTNTGFQLVSDPSKYGQLQAPQVADKFREEYTAALSQGNSPETAYAMATNNTRDFVKEDTMQRVIADGGSQSAAASAGEKAAAGYDHYIESTTKMFGSDLPSGAMIETDTANGGHLTVHGTNDMGLPVQQDYYLASAYSEPQGAYQTTTDEAGNAWHVVDHAQYDAGAVSNHEYFSESYMPEIGNVVSGQITDVDGSRMQEGIFTVSTEQERMIRNHNGTITPDIQRSEYQVVDAASYRPPQGEYQTIQDESGHQYYVAQGQEVVKTEPVKNKTTGEPVVDEKGSVVTKRAIAHNHVKPTKAQPPKRKE